MQTAEPPTTIAVKSGRAKVFESWITPSRGALVAVFRRAKPVRVNGSRNLRVFSQPVCVCWASLPSTERYVRAEHDTYAPSFEHKRPGCGWPELEVSSNLVNWRGRLDGDNISFRRPKSRSRSSFAPKLMPRSSAFHRVSRSRVELRTSFPIFFHTVSFNAADCSFFLFR